MAERADLDAVRAWLAAGPQKTTAREAALRSNAIAAINELRIARAVVSSAGVASIAVERLVNTLAKDRATWDNDAVAMWDAVQVLQQDLSLYRKATT